MHYPDADSLEHLMDQAAKVEEKLACLKATTHPQTQGAANPALRMTTLTSSGNIPHPSHLPGGVAPMDLSSGHPRLTQAECDYHRATGACIICGKTDHFMANCLICRHRPMAAASAAAPAPSRIESRNKESFV